MAPCMKIEIELTHSPIVPGFAPAPNGGQGAVVEFSGVVRGEEHGTPISALEYEAYPEMAEHQIRRLLDSLALRHTCLAARVVHRLGIVPVGQLAIYLGVAARHRAEGIALLAEFMDRLKQDVPIWKRRALAIPPLMPLSDGSSKAPATIPRKALSLDAAMAEIQSRCVALPGVRRPLADCVGHVLRENVIAPGDWPAFDCSTRDGYAVRVDDPGPEYQVVDTIHAAGWKPRQLQLGEAVRVATGAAMPCRGLRVVMQEHVERRGDRVHRVTMEEARNIRLQGEEKKAGETLLAPGTRLRSGALALLATAGCARPLVSPRLRVAHFTIGDELVAPDQTPGPGQVRDSNSMLLRGLLQGFPHDLEQVRLPEDLGAAWIALASCEVGRADVILISGGASVGDKDFTRELLERLGFEISFAQVNVRPGKPLIFGVQGSRVAFGLPGNPLAHWVCFHFAVAMALARLTGGSVPRFLPGRMAVRLEDAPVPRETLWPARLEISDGAWLIRPLPWASSGDVTCLAEADVLLRKPANTGTLEAGLAVEFLPAEARLGRLF